MLIIKDLLSNRDELPARRRQQHFRRSIILGDTFDVDANLRTTRLVGNFVFSPSTSNPGQTYEMRITPQEAGTVQIKNAVGPRPDKRRDPLPGDKRQPASERGVR